MPANHLYRCTVAFEPNPAGGFTVSVPQLPGVISEGATKEEARDNVRKALTAALRTYRDAGSDIPWKEVPVERGDTSVFVIG